MIKCIELITKNTAEAVNGQYLTQSYFDVIKPKKEEKAEDIINDVINKCGLIEKGE